VGNYLWVVYALGAFLMFGVTNYLLKYASVRGIPSIEGTVVLWVATGLVGLIAVILMIAGGMFNPVINVKLSNVDFKYFTVPVAAGITLAAGMYFLKAAVSVGKAGPATAIASSNAALVAALSWLLLNEKLSVSEVIGMTLYIAAVIVFTLKPLD